MKHFYNANPAVTVTRPAAKALGTALSSAKKIFMLMLLGFLLLASGEGYGQTTFTAVRSGNWNEPGTWNASGATIPGAADNVIIQAAFEVTVNDVREVNNLTLRFNNGNATPKIIINGSLTLNNLSIDVNNNSSNTKASITVNGNLTIKGTSTWATNGKYDFICGNTSTVTYRGTTVMVAPQTTTTGQNAVPVAGSYNNLVLSGTGAKSASADLQVRGNMLIDESATFSPGNFSHTITGNLTVQSASAGITGNSTVGGTNLTVRGNLTNNGTITFQSRNLTVAGNFNNNTGGIFNAGSGTHTISGNWTNTGALNAGTSTIVLDGASKRIATGTGAFNNLTISSGAPELLSDITVNSSLVVTNLILDTKNQKIVLGPAASLGFTETAAQHILGTIETTRSLPANRTNTEIFGNIGFRIPAGTADLGSVKVRRVTGKVYVSPITTNSSVKRQYYVSTESNLPPDGLTSRVDMNFPDYELNAGEKYTIYRVTGSNNEIVESLTNNFADDSDYRYRLNNAQKFGMYTLGNTVTPLPVELVAFKAQRHAQGVNLTWATASEKDNNGFEVQVSTDGKKFQKIGFVKSEVGTTSMAQRYSFLDTKAVSGTRYYRLAQIDLDGTTTYSAIRAMALDGANGEIAAYPNPFEEVVTVKLNGVEARKVNVTLTNSLGKVILEQQEETAGNTITVNTAGITIKGVYMLHVVDNGEKHTFKLMKR
jgi:hypothetical protein